MGKEIDLDFNKLEEMRETLFNAFNDAKEIYQTKLVTPEYRLHAISAMGAAATGLMAVDKEYTETKTLIDSLKR